MNETMIQQATEKALTVKDLFRRVDVVDRFAELMGSRNARTYIGSVLITVANKPELQACSPESILKSALRAAALELSCDESLHQAQLVPYNNKKTGKKEAQLIVHYLGLVNLAQRTGRYKVINYGPIKEGQDITADPLSGLHTITGRPTSRDAKTLGYFAYFKMLNGFEKSEYMTVEEIHDHARKFSPSYNSEYSKWKDAKMLPYLEQKTVIRKLMKSADMSGTAGQKLAEALEADEVIDVDLDLTKDAPKEIRPAAHDLIGQMGYETDNPNPVKDGTWRTWTDLVARANAVSVPHSNVDRSKTTDNDLQEYIKELTPFIRDAEDQAKVGMNL